MRPSYKLDKIVSKRCIRIMGIIQAVLMLVVSIYLLSYSFIASDNHTLRLLGESTDKSSSHNSRFDRKMANLFVMISFFCVICGGLAIAASWTQDNIMNYIFGYASLILLAVFISTGMSILILESKFFFKCF